MEPVNSSHLSDNLIRESDVLSEDDRDIRPTRKPPKAKQKKKASVVSLRDSGKTKSRTSKGRLSLPQTTQEMSKSLRFVTACDLKSNDGDHLSTFEELETEREDNSHAAARCLSQFTLDESDMTQHLERNEATSSWKNKDIEDGIMNLRIKEMLSWAKVPAPKNVHLEEKLAHDNEIDITGIMNLSSMNLTDSDMPMIIQRAFRGERKSCVGLILRDNALTSDGVKMLVDELLTGRKNLKYLSLSSNSGIGDAGIEHLTRLLQRNRSIIFLALPRTGITDRGVRLLADVLCGVDADSTGPPLEKLSISFNNLITDESLEALLQILEQNQTLKVLSLQHCSLSDRARRKLKQVGKKKTRKFSLLQ